MSLGEFYSNRGETLELEPLQPLWKPFADRPSRVRGGKLKITEGEYLDWLAPTRSVLEKWSQPFFEDAWANLFWFTGEYIPTVPLIMRTDAGSQVKIPRQLAPLAINFMNYLTNKRTAELSVYKATHDTQPLEETSSTDRMTSRVLKMLIERGKRINKMDDLFNEVEKSNMVHGWVYVSVDRNPFLGDKNTKTGKPVGETEVKLTHPWHVLPWRSRSWGETPFVLEIEEILHVEEARVKFKDPNIQPFGSNNLYTFSSPFVERISSEETVIFKAVYRPDMYMPSGAVIRSAGTDRVLSMEVDEYPWSHGQLHLERYTDIDIPSRFYPMSFYQNLKPMQHTYNNLSGLLKRYIFTLGHPKIIHERGSVNTKALGNSPSLIGVKPTAKFAPSIMQVKSIGSDPFNFHSMLESKMVQFSDTHKVGLGELPANTRSALMISRLREIENQQRGPQIDKRNSFMGAVLLKYGSVEADYLPYTPKDHIARVVGEDMVQDVKNLKDVKVSSETKVIIVNSSGFSAELTGRIAEIAAIETDAKLPLLPQEKRDIIGGVLRDKHYDVISAAKFTCQAQIEMMNTGRKPTPPRLTDDLITYWTTLSIEMQSIAHRRLPTKIQEMKETYLEMVEELIEKIISKNPTSLFAQKAKMLDGYPRLYNLTPEEEPSATAGTPAPENQPALDQVAAANGGPPLAQGAPPTVQPGQV